MSSPNVSNSNSNQSSDPTSQAPKSDRFRWVWLTFGLTGVAIVSAAAGALLAVALASTPLLQSNLSPEEADVFEQDDISSADFRLPRLTRPVNILVLGIKVISSDLQNPPPEVRDLGYHSLVNSFEGLSDTMMLIRFTPDTQELNVLSLPRDTRTWVDGIGTTKLNEANIYGGPALTAQAVSELLGGVGIDRYVRINVQGVEKLIDALGGVTVYITDDMQYTDESQHLYIDLEQGEQHLDGEQAIQFLRFRYDAYGDIGRVQRQQMFMRALVEQTLSPRTVARLPKILSVIQSHVDTNLSVEELIALVGFASQTDRSDTNMLMLPGDFSSPGDYDLSYWIPDQERIDEIVRQHFLTGSGYAEQVDPEYLRVAIQDSTGQPEAVDTLIDQLNDAGYWNVSVESDWEEPLSQTRIIAQQGDSTSAEAIRSALGIGEVRVESTGVLQSDVTIQLGRDWTR
ncbi:MAG TPA: LCP family protein [Elainellaceae cyanobacterium]